MAARKCTYTFPCPPLLFVTQTGDCHLHSNTMSQRQCIRIAPTFPSFEFVKYPRACGTRQCEPFAHLHMPNKHTKQCVSVHKWPTECPLCYLNLHVRRENRKHHMKDEKTGQNREGTHPTPHVDGAHTLPIDVLEKGTHRGLSPPVRRRFV